MGCTLFGRVPAFRYTVNLKRKVLSKRTSPKHKDKEQSTKHKAQSTKHKAQSTKFKLPFVTTSNINLAQVDAFSEFTPVIQGRSESHRLSIGHAGGTGPCSFARPGFRCRRLCHHIP